MEILIFQGFPWGYVCRGSEPGLPEVPRQKCSANETYICKSMTDSGRSTVFCIGPLHKFSNSDTKLFRPKYRAERNHRMAGDQWLCSQHTTESTVQKRAGP